MSAHRVSHIAWGRLLLWTLVAVGVGLRLGLVTGQRFHGDEAIYGYWAQLITSGRDPMLLSVPLDKPPLFIYLLAGVFKLFGPTEVTARLISQAASVAAIILTYRLGRRFYGWPVALLAATVMTLSPFNLLFAPTAFTDPLMVALSLGAMDVAAAGRWEWAGVMVGLGMATKQQGILFAPLVLAGGWATVQNPLDLSRDIALREPHPLTESISTRHHVWSVARMGLGFLSVALLFTGWDALRWRAQASFWEQSVISHGPLHLVKWWELGERLAGWSELLGYTFGSPVLNGVLLLGVPLLLWRGRQSLCSPNGCMRLARTDWLLASFSAIFFLGHWLFSFSVWDRYLLGLVPLASLLLARVVWQGCGLIFHWTTRLSALSLWRERSTRRLAKDATVQNLRPWNWALTSPECSFDLDGRTIKQIVLVGLMVVALLVWPVTEAARGSYPIGGDNGAHQGLEQVIAFLRHEVPVGSVVWHRYLGWHYFFYLFDAPLDLNWYADPTILAAQVSHATDVPNYVAFPTWEKAAEPEARAALEARGHRLVLERRAWREDGRLAFSVYRIVSTGAQSGGAWATENQ